MIRATVILFFTFSFSCSAMTARYDTVEISEGTKHFTAFQASSETCDFKITSWKNLQGDVTGSNMTFVDDVTFILEGKKYHTNKLVVLNFNHNKDCKIESDLVWLSNEQ